MKEKLPLAVVLGPTACGKSALALELAERLQGEIISGDSMQVYRGLDIGTAKLPLSERRYIPHHLIDILPPDAAFNVADFRDRAAQAIREIHHRGKLPILVGGTGLYIDALLYPYHFAAESAPDPALRSRLQQEYREEGAPAMHRRLQAIDPAAAARIHPNDAHRLLRALEVYECTGTPLSSHQQIKPGNAYHAVIIGLTCEREPLYRNIEARVDAMFAAGLGEEVRGLLQSGLPRQAQSMQGIGYRQTAAWLCGETDRETAIALIKRDTRRFAKRQFTWFKRNPDIVWFDIGQYSAAKSLATAAEAQLVSRLKEDEK